MKVKIMCGVSGSGKSTYIKNHFPDAVVCSADHFFMENGEYKFDPSKLSQAHGQCLQGFVDEVSGTYDPMLKKDVIVVDNTNTSLAEIAPYAALALAYGHDLEILVIDADVEKAYSRNTHGVPKQGVMGQHARLKKLGESLPPWWPCRRVKMEG